VSCGLSVTDVRRQTRWPSNYSATTQAERAAGVGRFMVDRQVLTAAESSWTTLSPRGLIACQLGHALSRPTLNYNSLAFLPPTTRPSRSTTWTPRQRVSVDNRCVTVIRRRRLDSRLWRWTTTSTSCRVRQWKQSSPPQSHDSHESMLP